MRKAVAALSLLLAVLFTTNSCKKTTEGQLVNGLWHLNTVLLDTSTSNYLNKYPNFGGTCCGYKLSFQEPNILFAYYISNDSIKTLSTGIFTVNSYTEVYMRVDSFIDGTFTISRPTLSHFELTCDRNHIRAFDNGVNPGFDTSYTKLDMTR